MRVLLIVLIALVVCTSGCKVTARVSTEGTHDGTHDSQSVSQNQNTTTQQENSAVSETTTSTTTVQNTNTTTVTEPSMTAGGAVVAEGQGVSLSAATNDALRAAVEMVAGVKIFSETVVQDFVAVKDAIVSESFGIVTSYKVLSKQKDGSIHIVKVEVFVSKDVKSRWDQIKAILRQKGNPTIMFCLKETLDGVPTPQATGEIRLVSKFRELGFQVIDRNEFENTKQLHMQLNTLEGNHNAIIAAASDRGADLTVVGMLEGTYKGTMDFYGTEQIQYNYIYGTKIIRTDTSQVIGSKTATYLHGESSMNYSQQAAGRAGFAKVVSAKYIQPVIADLVKTWVQETQNTGTPITVIITDAKYSWKKKVKNGLMDGSANIKDVDVKGYAAKQLTLRVMSMISGEDLAETLEEIPGLPMEVIEAKKNWIKLRCLEQ